jgi:hypothetical protein
MIVLDSEAWLALSTSHPTASPASPLPKLHTTNALVTASTVQCILAGECGLTSLLHSVEQHLLASHVKNKI